MALTGIEIFKLLPKTNCGDCGIPTCLAFAMALAAGKAELERCPHLSEETVQKLSEASAPPVLPVTIGTGENTLKIGGETVMFRHEKRFENAPGIALLISDTMSEEEVVARIRKTHHFQYQRAGARLYSKLVALRADSGSAETFGTLAEKVASFDTNIILVSDNPDLLAAGLKACSDRKPLLCGVTSANAEAVIAMAKENGCPVSVRADDLESLAELASKVAAAGLKNIVLDTGARQPDNALQDMVMVRTAALARKHKGLAYPTIVFPCDMTSDPMKETMLAAAFVAKYAGIIVLSDFTGETLFPLLVARLNIYTDPQRPLAMTQGIYEINNPDETSPLLITSNFALTYFLVSGEIENSQVPAFLYVKDTEGLSVLTAWAAGKFNADVIAPALLKSGIEDKIKHRRLIIPGYVSVESGALEDALPGWEIIVGPREAAQLPAFLKNREL